MRILAVRAQRALVLGALLAGAAALASGAARAQDDAGGAGGGRLSGANGVQKRGSVTTCTARNALASRQCTATCQPGQTADCLDSDDGSDPSCTCSGP